MYLNIDLDHDTKQNSLIHTHKKLYQNYRAEIIFWDLEALLDLQSYKR